jgi:hypothetical protein
MGRERNHFWLGHRGRDPRAHLLSPVQRLVRVRRRRHRIAALGDVPAGGDAAGGPNRNPGLGGRRFRLQVPGDTNRLDTY